MLKVLKNLKKTWFSVVVIVLLLCLQATTDLALPDYISRIVNVGIQQGGVQNLSPEVMKESTMSRLLVLSNYDEKITNNYELISKESLSQKEYEKYVKKYPALENEKLYMNENSYIGKNKQEIVDIIKKSYDIIHIIEI